MNIILRTLAVNALTWSSLAYAQAGTPSAIQTSPEFKRAWTEHKLQSLQALNHFKGASNAKLAYLWRTEIIPAHQRVLNSVKSLPPVYAMDLEVQTLLVKYDRKLRAELFFFQKPSEKMMKQAKYYGRLYSAYLNEVSSRARPDGLPGRSIASQPAPAGPNTPQGRAAKAAWEFAQVSIEAGGMLKDIGRGKYTVAAAMVLLRDHLPERLEKVKAEMVAVKPLLPPALQEEIGDHIRTADLEIKLFFQAYKLLATNDDTYAVLMKETQKEIEAMTERQKARNIKRQVASKAKFTESEPVFFWAAPRPKKRLAQIE